MQTGEAFSAALPCIETEPPARGSRSGSQCRGTRTPRVPLVLTHLLLALLMQQLPQVVEAAGDGALVGVGVLQVLVGDVGTGREGAFGLVQVAPVHQDDSHVQVRR